LIKKTASLVLRLAIVAACLAYSFWDLDFTELMNALRGYDILGLVVTVAFSFAGYWAMALRFNYLSNFESGNWLCFKAFFLCMAVNNIAPAKLGEVAKAFYMRRECGFSLGRSLSMVFWERFYDLNAILALGVAVAFYFNVKMAFIPLAVGVPSIWAILWVLRMYPAFSDKIIRLMPSSRLSEFLAELKLQLVHSVSLKMLIALVGYTGLCWALYAGTGLLTLLWVAKLPITFFQAVAVFTLSALGMAVPSTPGAFGVFEAAVVFALSLFGVSKGEALAAGLVLHMIQYIPVTVVGALILAKSGLNLRKIRERDEALDESAS